MKGMKHMKKDISGKPMHPSCSSCASWLTLVAALAAGASLGAQVAQREDPAAIQRMAATERAFAAAAAEIGVRDSFLTFFADDAVALVRPGPGKDTTTARARDQIAAQALQRLPLANKLIWEPFTGHISGDGTLGWLTGGYAALSNATHEIVAKGAYFSVWKRQSNGTWRVWLDEGIALPDVWRDATPFRAAPEPDAGTTGSPNEQIEAAEARVAAGGDAWRASLGADVRLHRDGVMPLVGRDAAAAWAHDAWRSVQYGSLTGTVAGSDDLAVVAGTYTATTGSGPETGSWVRVWKRDVTTRWRIVFETSHKS